LRVNAGAAFENRAAGAAAVTRALGEQRRERLRADPKL
jgi:hypothetical protein